MYSELIILFGSLIVFAVSAVGIRIMIKEQPKEGTKYIGIYMICFFTLFITMVGSFICGFYSWMFYWLK